MKTEHRDAFILLTLVVLEIWGFLTLDLMTYKMPCSTTIEQPFIVGHPVFCLGSPMAICLTIGGYLIFKGEKNENATTKETKSD